MDGKSLNITEEKLSRLKEIIPEAFTENKIDWEKLKAALGDDIEFKNERYVLNWAGKSDAFRALQSPSTATLVPCKEESVNFDKTENIFIEGENLEVLKVLQKSYFGKIKMIYIDPPYNTGNDNFIYPDKFSETKEEYLNRIGDKDETGFMTREGLFRKNSKDSGHYHSNWLSMMYPRLFLARNLLRDDGVIFVSIDDNEVHNLRLLINEVFGEENFVAQLTLLCNPKGRAQDKHFATNHEYVFVYSKNLLPKGSFNIEKEKEQLEVEYTEEDDDGKYRTLELRNTHREFGKHNRKNLYYPIFVDAITGEIQLNPFENSIEVLPNWDDGFEGCWTWGKPKAESEVAFLTGKKVNGNWKIYVKEYANGASKMLKTILVDKSYYTEKGQKSFNTLFKSKGKIFQSPKSPELLSQLLKTSTMADDIILDFFSGSCTTAHAILDLNNEDASTGSAQAGNRKFICVQFPEKCDENSEAFKAGYKTIAEIGKERIRRVIKKIKEEQKGKLDLDGRAGKQDLGFKVFKLQESNFKIWRSRIESEEELVKQLQRHLEPLDERAKTEDVLYELLLKSGVPLTANIEEKNGYILVNDKEIALLLEKVDEKIVKKVIADKPRKVITLDRLFKNNDRLKTNTALQMKDAGIEFKAV
jgi:Adenine specific DNA methylase Mod